MVTILRHLLAILLLPFIVVVIVPAWLLGAFGTDGGHWVEASALVWLLRAIGLGLLIVGLGLFSWCVSLFVQVGRGTLAPWDPTRSLVAVGPYRFVRNPMISGVEAMLVGEALLWGSLALGLWASVFAGINHVYIVLVEEPGLEQRFGEPYRVYKESVPRWIPRFRRP